MNQYPDANSVIVYDNATIHRGARIQQICNIAGIRLIYLPPYCPELNPIELCFALIKQKLRASQNLSHVADSKWEIQKVAADVMTKDLCYKLVEHCGYCVPTD
jgi:transposase